MNKATAFTTLPTLGQPFAGGTSAGITTQQNGTHVAVVLLPSQASDVTWQDAMYWTKSLDAVLPSRPVAALLFANLQPNLRHEWHWTSEEYEGDASHAWLCGFGSGYQTGNLKSCKGSAVAVRCIPLVS